MNWNFAIERWRVPLIGEVVKLFAKIGLTEGGTVERVPKPVYRYVLGILRTAESAVRRLIFAAARDIVVEYKPRPPRKSSGENKRPAKQEGKAKRKRGFLFRLFDPPKRVSRNSSAARRNAGGWSPASITSLTIRGFRGSSGNTSHHRHPCPTAPVPDVEERVDDGTVDARPLIRRLMAAKHALEDIPRHALRLARWRARPKKSAVPSAGAPCAPAGRRDFASGQNTRSTRSSKSATGSPAMPSRSSTRLEAH